MTTTREEAERISKTDDVAAAIRYLVDSLSINAAVDLVHAVMNAVRAEPVQEDKAVGGTYKDSSITKALIYNGVNLPVGTLLYTRQQSDELIKAAEDVLELFLRVWISDDGINLTPEDKGKLNALRIELDKFK